MGNQVTLDAEKQRLLGLNTLIEQVGGFPSDVYVDFVEETFALLDKLSGLVGHTEQAISVLEEAFNDASISNSIMYHLRMLATAYLKGHRDQYAAFLEMEGGVDVYCDRVLNRHGVEIDHLGIVLLSNVLLKDAGFVLEIAYLDRSPGSEVNKYRFPEEANARQPPELGPVIYLLFRPDHYDILYVPEPEPVNIQVHRVDTFTQPFQIGSAPIPMQGFGAINMQTLSMIPGIGSIGMQPSPLSGILDPTPSPLAYNQAPVSTTPWMQTPYVDPLTQAAPPPPPMPMPAAAPAASSVQQLHPVRFSEWCLRNNATDKNWRREQTLQTSTFKNSHFNTAHFNNPDFQPEEYKPEQDERNTPPRGGGKKRGSV
jgi:ubiquitin thioesterase protein OTUB1